MKKLITTKETKKFSNEYGWLRVITYYFLNVRFWSEHYLLFEPKQEEKPIKRHEIAEMEDYQDWREKMHLMRLSDDEFMQIINSRF